MALTDAATPNLPRKSRQYTAWALWMALQWATLACFCAQVPPAARVLPPMEDAAVRATVFVQLLGLVVLAPALVGTRLGVVAVVAGGWPMLTASVGLAATDGETLGATAILLAVWATILSTRSGQASRPALTLYVIAVPVAAYALSEARAVDKVALLLKTFPLLQSSPTSLHIGNIWPLLAIPVILCAITGCYHQVSQPVNDCQ